MDIEKVLSNKIGRYGDLTRYSKINCFNNCIYILKYEDLYYVGATNNLRNRLSQCHSFIKSINECRNIEVFICYNDLKLDDMKDKENEIINILSNNRFNLANKMKSGYVPIKENPKLIKVTDSELFDSYIQELNCFSITHDRNFKLIYLQGADESINDIHRQNGDKIIYSKEFDYFLNNLMGDYDDFCSLLYDMKYYIKNEIHYRNYDLSEYSKKIIISDFLLYELNIELSVLENSNIVNLMFKLLNV